MAGVVRGPERPRRPPSALSASMDERDHQETFLGVGGWDSLIKGKTMSFYIKKEKKIKEPKLHDEISTMV
jgi:hypothetical protein